MIVATEYETLEEYNSALSSLKKEDIVATYAYSESYSSWDEDNEQCVKSYMRYVIVIEEGGRK